MTRLTAAFLALAVAALAGLAFLVIPAWQRAAGELAGLMSG